MKVDYNKTLITCKSKILFITSDEYKHIIHISFAKCIITTIINLCYTISICVGIHRT